MRQITQIALLLPLTAALARAAWQIPVTNWEQSDIAATTAPLPTTRSGEIASRTLLLGGLAWIAGRSLRARRSAIPAAS